MEVWCPAHCLVRNKDLIGSTSALAFTYVVIANGRGKSIKLGQTHTQRSHTERDFLETARKSPKLVSLADLHSVEKVISADEIVGACPHAFLLMESNCSFHHEDFGVIRYMTYGIIFPVLCSLGILGNTLNLIVLSQKNYQKGSAFVYMRGYSGASLLALLVAIPFGFRIHFQPASAWTNFYQAFFHTHLELYLGNSALGVGVMLLVALTLERYFAVVHPEKSRLNSSGWVVTGISLGTMVIYLPHTFRARVNECLYQGFPMFEKLERTEFLASPFYRTYVWILAIVFRLGPTLLLAFLNLRIIAAYKRTCRNRRRMTGKVSRDEKKKYQEESRIMLLLGSTSVLFFICVTPMVLLSILITPQLLKSLPFQVFRAVANSLEVTNYSITFYIYMLFSKEFRRTFLELFSRKGQKNRKACLKPTPRGGDPRDSATPLTPGGSTPLL